MFDTMTLTKTVGALCGALLIFLLGNWASQTIYRGGGDGEGQQQAYAIDTGEAQAAAVADVAREEAQAAAVADVAREEAAPKAEAVAETEAETVATTEPAEPAAPVADATGGFAALVAAADPEAGKKVFNKCKSCHVPDKDQNRVGPHLVGIVGRDVASAEGFGYSDALTAVSGQWTADRLDAWLEDPKSFAPGNKMTFPGLRKQEERASVIAWLQSLAN